MAKRDPISGVTGKGRVDRPAPAPPPRDVGPLSHDPALPDAPADDLAPLVQQAARGEQAAWEELLARYAPRVFAMARSRLGDGDAADDIVQSVFATLARTLNRPASGQDLNATGSPAATGYQERGRFESWLFRITMNRVRDEARRRRSRVPSVDPSTIDERLLADDIPGPSGAEPDPGVLALRRAMESLGEADREVIELRHHAQMAFKDIAELLGQPVGTVLARHHRALKKLKQILEPEP